MHFFALISRMRDIRRWGLMRNTFEENVQEHSHMVAVIAHALAVIGRDVYGRDTQPDRCAVAALYHDASEILTGDLPTPVKYHNPEIREAYHKIEAHAQTRLLRHLPEPLRESIGSYMLPDRLDGLTRDYVHAADKLSAYIKCVEERRAGNAEFKSAGDSLLAALEKSDMPEVKYFLDNFIPSFGMTLDEQSG